MVSLVLDLADRAEAVERGLCGLVLRMGEWHLGQILGDLLSSACASVLVFGSGDGDLLFAVLLEVVLFALSPGISVLSALDCRTDLLDVSEALETASSSVAWSFASPRETESLEGLALLELLLTLDLPDNALADLW